MKIEKVRLTLPSVSLPPDFWDRIKLFSLPIVAIVFSVGLVAVLARPKVVDISKLRSEVKANQEKRDILNEKVNSLKALNLNELQENAKLINQALPVHKDVQNAVIGLERLSAETGLVINSLSLTPGQIATESANFGSLDINISLGGPYLSVKNFISELNRSLRLFSIKSLSLSVDNDGGATANFTLAIYFAPIPKFRDVVDKPLPRITEREKNILTELSQYQPITSTVVIQSTGSANPFLKPNLVGGE